MNRNRRITILLIAVATVALIQTPIVMAFSDYSETFEDDAAALAPDSDWYDLTTVGAGEARVSTAEALGTKSYLQSGTITLASFTSETDNDWDFCNPNSQGSLSLAFRIETYGSVNIGLDDEDGDLSVAGVYMQISVTGAVSFVAGNGIAPTTAATGVTVALNTWQNATFFLPEGCATSDRVTLYLHEQDVPVTITLPNTVTATGLDRIVVDPSASTPKVYLDNLFISDVNDPPPTAVGSSATVAVTDLIGFDVDPSGRNLIARTDNGATVATYNPYGGGDTTLDLINDDPNTDCMSDRFDGVVATGFGVPDAVVGYLTCDVGANDPNFFRIRNQNLDFPEIGCAAECDFDIALQNDVVLCTGEFEDRTDLLNIKQIFEVPLDYSKQVQDPFGEDPHLAVAWAYTTEAGRIGVAQYTTQDGCNGYNTARTSYSSTAPEDFCSWRHNNRNYLAAVDVASPTQIWTYNYGTSSSGAALLGTISTPVVFSSLSGGLGISCAADKILVQRAGTITMVDIDDGSVVWSKSVSNAPLRGVELDPSGQYVAYVDDTVAGNPYPVYIAWASNGTSFGTVTSPTAFWYGMRMDYGAQNLWIATESLIAHYAIGEAFEQIDETCTGVSCVNPTPTPGAGVDGFGAISDSFNQLFGSGGTAMFGLFLMLFAAGIGFAVFGGIKKIQNKEPIGNGPPIGAGVFAAVMFFVCAAAGIFSPLLTFGVIGGVILLVVGVKVIGARA